MKEREREGEKSGRGRGREQIHIYIVMVEGRVFSFVLLVYSERGTRESIFV